MEFLIGILSGAAGGNIIGALARKLSMGVLGNSIAGIVGGGLGGGLLGKLGLLASGGGGAEIINGVAGGGAGGGLVMVVIGLIRKMMAK